MDRADELRAAREAFLKQGSRRLTLVADDLGIRRRRRDGVHESGCDRARDRTENEEVPVATGDGDEATGDNDGDDNREHVREDCRGITSARVRMSGNDVDVLSMPDLTALWWRTAW